jgi:hypothetical protein
MGPLGDEAMATILSMQRANANITKRAEIEAKEQDKALGALAETANAVTNVQGSFERSEAKAVGTEESMDIITRQLDKLANEVLAPQKLAEITDNIGEAGADLISALDGTANGLLDLANDIISPDYSTGEIIAAGLAGMFLSTTVVKAAGSAILGGLGKLLGVKSLGGALSTTGAAAGGLSTGAALGVAGAGIVGYGAGSLFNTGYERLTGSSVGSDLFDFFTGGSQEAQVAAMLSSSNVNVRNSPGVMPTDQGASVSKSTPPTSASLTTSSSQTTMDSINSLISVVQEQTSAVHRSNEQLDMAVSHLKQIRRNTEDT